MTDSSDVAVVIVGSAALDSVETPIEKRDDVLGGSVSYACTAASFFGSVGMVGVVGSDFPEEHVDLYNSFGIDLAGLQRAAGQTFRWSGVYETDMNVRRTLSTELNVFADFRPALPRSYKRAPFLFLGNIAPELHLHVLDEVSRPRFAVADTMDLWINTSRESLLEVLKRVDLLMLNDSEVQQLAEEHGIVKAARTVLGMGPKYVLVKRGEHGATLFSQERAFFAPAYPVVDVLDPTGAGDSFAGGFMGALAAGGDVTERSVRTSMLAGSVLASFCVEAFSLERFVGLNRAVIDQRIEELKRMMAL